MRRETEECLQGCFDICKSSGSSSENSECTSDDCSKCLGIVGIIFLVGGIILTATGVQCFSDVNDQRSNSTYATNTTELANTPDDGKCWTTYPQWCSIALTNNMLFCALLGIFL